MVGTNPRNGPGTTHAQTVLVPVDLNAPSGDQFNGSSRAAETHNSPIFRYEPYSTGGTQVATGTQYGDAIQRAEFWKDVSTTDGGDYHVLLDDPTILPTLHLDVPSDGKIVVEFTVGPGHRPLLLLRLDWWAAVVKQITSELPGNVVPVILTKDVVLFIHNPSICCIIGFHGTTSSRSNTAVWANYLSPKIFCCDIEDVYPLSHEVSEWINDPYINNLVPPWFTPTAPQYGCNPYLETGDPVVGFGFEESTFAGTYHMSDEAFYSWFARQRPSAGVNGYYTYLNTFPHAARGCG
jgi:hypothetical protein